MNSTLVSHDIVASPPLQRAQFFIELNHLEAPTPLYLGDISDDLTVFSSTNGALRAVKGTKKGSESRDGLS